MANEPPETIPPENETPVPEILIPEVMGDAEGGPAPEEPDEPPPQNQPDYALVEEAVAFISQTIEEMGKTVFLKVGDYLLTRFFNDNVLLASSKNRYKSMSYTELCRHTDLPVTRRQLGVMIRMAAQERYLILTHVDVSRLCHIKKSYLIQLPDGDEKYVLAQKCIQENWTSRELYARIRQMKQAAIPYENPNQKIVNRYKKTMSRLISGSVTPELLSTQEGLYRLDRETLLQLKEDAAKWVAALEAKAEECAALITQVDYTVAHPNY
ncbi:MAG: hypothetical protein WA081_18740 [Desulfosalsimonadaceae bacterium]